MIIFINKKYKINRNPTKIITMANEKDFSQNFPKLLLNQIHMHLVDHG